MSKLIDIKNKIDQLDGGSFQNLCDAYLSFKGYNNGYSLGMKSGTNKTTPGSPDTYFTTSESKYVFVMYTTQKTDFIKKVIEDINKCLNSQRTGIHPNDITEIIYCHTYNRLEPKQDQHLKQYCKNYGISLTIIGLDKLGYDIFHDYPVLAKDFLGINIDSGQILPLNAFISKHDANKMSAPLNTNFLFRKDELIKAKTSLSNKDILLITGPAGVGKTRFAIELCQQLQQEKKYTVLIIKNNNLQLYEDLVYAIEKNKEYLIVVDDANELSGLQYVLNYLTNPTDSQHISKLILTVRDYAHKQVIEKVMEITEPELIKLSVFNDDEIQTLMKKCYGINNHIFINRIISISKGNARLAMLAGKLATDSDKGFKSIMDASDLYHTYYHKQLNTVIESKTGKYSAGIIAFIQSIHLDYLENLTPIFEDLKITSEDFISDLKLLHKAEIVDLCNDMAAKISDQSFSNFLIKYTFIEEKIIPLSSMVEICLKINRNRVIEACNILINVFSSHGVNEYVEKQIMQVWNKLENDETNFLPFIKAFHMINPTGTLLFLKKQIDQEEYHFLNVQSLDLKENESSTYLSNDILEILSNFIDHPELSTAIDLLLLYYKKRPDLYKQFYHTIAKRFEVNLNSQNCRYYTQCTVVKKLCEAVKANFEDNNLLVLFICFAEHFLKLSFQKAESYQRNKISVYTLTLEPDEPVLEYRKMLIAQLYQIYKHGYLQTEIEHILHNYGIYYNAKEVNIKVITAELNEILNFFQLFQPNNLYHCIIAKHIEEITKKINYYLGNILDQFLNSKKFIIYSTLALPTYKNFLEGHEQRRQRNKTTIMNLIGNYTTSEIDYLIQICLESFQTFDKNTFSLELGLRFVFEIFQNQKSLYLYLLDSYLKADTPYCVNPELILNKLFEIMPVTEVKKIITKHQYTQQNTWLWNFYTLIPEQQITTQWVTELLLYLDKPDSSIIKRYSYRDINMLRKYETIEPKIVFKALHIIASHYQESPFIFSLYVFSILNHINQQEANTILNEFYNELPL